MLFCLQKMNGSQFMFSHCFAVRFAPIRPLHLSLTPLQFEVPHTAEPSLFVGREWLYREIEQVCQPLER